MEKEHGQEHTGSCCSSGVGRSWTVAESFEEMDFHKSLSAAAISNDMPRMHHLFSRGASPDTPDPSGYTPLHYAARNGNLDACLLLLQIGVAGVEESSRGRIAERIDHWSQNGARVDECTRAGKATSLHRAAYAGHIDVVKLLLKAGAKPFKEDVDGLTPLQKAEAQGHAEVVKLLVNATCESSKASRTTEIPMI